MSDLQASILSSIDMASFDASKNARSDKKAKKLLAVLYKDDEESTQRLQQLMLKFGPTQSANLVLHFLIRDLGMAIDHKFVSDDAHLHYASPKFDEVKASADIPAAPEAPAAPAAPAKKAVKKPAGKAVKGTGYNFQGSDQVGEVFKQAKLLRRQLTVKAIPFLNRIAAFLQNAELLASADASTFACIHQSGLQSALEHLMSDSAMDDVLENMQLWELLLKLCVVLCERPQLIAMLAPKHYSLPKDLKPKHGIGMHAILSDVHASFEAHECPEDKKENVDKVMHQLDVIFKLVKENEQYFKGGKASAPFDEKYDAPVSAEEVKETDQDVRKKIMEFLREKQFGTADFTGEPNKFSKELEESKNMPLDKKRLVRIRKELNILSHALPDGIFVRVSEDRADCIKVLITGPEGTPYQNGCFEFDLFLPATFPAQPPKMRLTTVGPGFRFNPNLYVDGYVCLSLLGTWQGPGWDPENSTLLQLLVSLQAMVLCEEPYCNEPGWYSNTGSQASKQYSKQVSRATALYAMLWKLKEETKGTSPFFRDVVKAYFFMQREEILKQLEHWDNIYKDVTDAWAYGKESMPLSTDWDTCRKELTDLLNALASPVN